MPLISGKSVNGALVLAFLLLAVLTAFGYRLAHGMVQARQELLEARGALAATTRLQVSLAAAIAATRGYVITGENAFLEEHRVALAELRQQADNLRGTSTLLIAYPNLFGRLAELVAQRAAVLERNIELRQQVSRAEVERFIAAGPGRELDQQIHRLIADVIELERTTMEERFEHSEQQVRNIFFALGLSLAAAFALLLLAFSATRRALKAFRQATDFAEGTVEAVQIPLLVLRSDLTGLYANRAFSDTWGVAKEQVRGGAIAAICAGIFNDGELAAGLRRVAEKGEIIEGRRHRCTTGGEERVVELSARRVQQRGGDSDIVVLALRDVTALERSTSDLARSQAMFRRLFENSPDALILVNEHRRIIRFNTKAAELFGLSGEQGANRTIEELMPERYRARHVAHFATYFSTPRARPMGAGLQLFGLRHDGSEFPVDIMLSPLETEEGKQVLAVIRDITERAESQSRIEQLNADLTRRAGELEQANQELEAFSYSVSHDLRAPLRHISGFAEMLKAHAEKTLDSKGLRYLDTITESARRMGTLIDDLLSLSRVGRTAFTPKPVDLAALVEEVRRSLERDTQGRNVRWIVGPLPEVRGDVATLRQVVYNLLANALKYSRNRSEAVIEIGATQSTEGEATCYVRDNGAGFDMKYIDKLFGVFQRLHGATEFEGTGVGLAIVRRIVHRHGGRVWAEGEVGKGATFYFTLPLASAATVARS
jgi:PAS domain S-box-containing protein